jgi:hypothetical protein
VSTFDLLVNGKQQRVESWDPEQPLLYALRNDLRLHGGTAMSTVALLHVTPVPAALANAVFDATGARLYEVPFAPERVRAAMQGIA